MKQEIKRREYLKIHAFDEFIGNYYSIDCLLEMDLPGLPRNKDDMLYWAGGVNRAYISSKDEVSFIALPTEAKIAIFSNPKKGRETLQREEIEGWRGVLVALKYFSTERRVKILRHILASEEEKLQGQSADTTFWELRKR